MSTGSNATKKKSVVPCAVNGVVGPGLSPGAVAPAPSHNKPWVDTVNDLAQYKPSKEELEAKKAQRKSQNKVLAKVSLADKRSLQDPERQRLVQHQVMRDYSRQPNQNVEAILARSEQVMGICQGILNGEMITPSYSVPLLSPATSLPSLSPEAVPGPGPQGGDLGPGHQHTMETERLRSSSVSVGSSSNVSTSPPAPPPNPPYMNSAALNEIAGELLITVRELREELLQEREARERLEREVLQQRELLSELAREVLRLQIHCSQPMVPQACERVSHPDTNTGAAQEGTRIV